MDTYYLTPAISTSTVMLFPQTRSNLKYSGFFQRITELKMKWNISILIGYISRCWVEVKCFLSRDVWKKRRGGKGCFFPLQNAVWARLSRQFHISANHFCPLLYLIQSGTENCTIASITHSTNFSPILTSPPRVSGLNGTIEGYCSGFPGLLQTSPFYFTDSCAFNPPF